MSKYLPIVFKAPLQSWGTKTAFDERPTDNFVSRSAVLGILLAAMGVDREDEDTLARLSQELQFTWALVTPEGTSPNHNSFRYRDFHTLHCVREPQSYKHVGDGTQVTQRDYLTDSLQGMVLEGSEDELKKLSQALRNPKWGGWLGRKACVPTWPIYGRSGHPELLPSLDAAERWLQEEAKAIYAVQETGNAPCSFRVLIWGKDDLHTFGEGARRDVPRSFFQRRYTHQ